MRVDANGAATPVTAVDPGRKESSHGYPVLLPDGRHFLYLRASDTPENRGIYAGSLDAKPEQQDLKLVLRNGFGAAYAKPPGSSKGQLLFFRDGSVLAQSFDPKRLALTGEPVRVADQVDSGTSGFAYFSASTNGVLVYRTGGAALDRRLTWLDREGKLVGTAGESGRYSTTLKVSPEGKRAAYDRLTDPNGNLDVFVMNLESGGTTRLTSSSGSDSARQPVWSRDGNLVAYQVQHAGKWGVFQRAADGSGAEQRIADLSGWPGSPNLYDWTHDGRYILYSLTRGPRSLADIWALPTDGGAPIPVVQTEFNEAGAYLSPNGRWIAYRSNESGHNEIHVQAFRPSPDGKAAPGSKWMVSKGGALGMARWRRDGRELLYLGADGRIMAVPVTTEPNFTAGTPVALFQLPKSLLALSSTPGSSIDVTSDNQRFLVEMPVMKTPLDEFTVVLNWSAGLKK